MTVLTIQPSGCRSIVGHLGYPDDVVGSPDKVEALNRATKGLDQPSGLGNTRGSPLGQ